MVDIIGQNGKADIENAADGWAIVTAQGQRMIGRVVIATHAPAGRFLDPAYELHSQIQANPQNPQQLGVFYAVLPLYGCLSLKRIELPEGALITPLSDLAPHERANLLSAVRHGESMMEQLRASQLGLVKATAMPPAPPARS